MAVYLTEQSTVLEGNLLASIITTQDKIREWATIANVRKDMEAKEVVDEKKEENEEDSTIIGEENNQDTEMPEEDNEKPRNDVNTTNQYRYDDVFLDYPYCITISEILVNETSSLLSKNQFITYGIHIRRLIDGDVHVVHRRFRDIKAWYTDLIKSFEDINISEVAEFPQYSESWLSSKRADPNSEVVQRRKRDLEVNKFEVNHYVKCKLHSL